MTGNEINGGCTVEFNEKLQELRKSKEFTQEELAEALYVSRTAISKWESGRGYPSIDSLKEISRFFSVSIDDLLSSERVICIAEEENKSNIQGVCDLLFGIVDLMSLMLIILPLYPKTMDGYIYSVNLFEYTGLSSANRALYWLMFILLVLSGAVKVALNQLGIEKGRNILTGTSVAVSVAAVLHLAMTRQAYAIVIAFILLVIKAILLLKSKGHTSP